MTEGYLEDDGAMTKVMVVIAMAVKVRKEVMVVIVMGVTVGKGVMVTTVMGIIAVMTTAAVFPSTRSIWAAHPT